MNAFNTDIRSQSLLLNGTSFQATDRASLISTLREEGPDSFASSLATFLEEWFDNSPTVTVHTSGSTGTPKLMRVEKRRMMNSACMTIAFLGLQPGDNTLLCMPLKYIAGKMVVVRALVGGLNLIPVTPCGHPLSSTGNPLHFAAMTPMQAFNSLQTQEEAIRLQHVKQLIIGGGAINPSLEKALKDFPENVWSTYGMTETLSHIALRRLNGTSASAWYTPLQGVRLSLSTKGTLVIDAPAVAASTLVTNDLAELRPDGTFRILGRMDNTINTGGVKVQIEEVEEILRPYLSLPFLITSIPDPRLGERIVLLTEGSSDDPSLQEACANLHPYKRPKEIVHVTHIPLTGTGKPDRAVAKEMAAEACR